MIMGDQASIDLLVTDINMLPISGFQVVRELRNAGIRCPVIFISGLGSIIGIIADSVAPYSVMEKPFTGSALRAMVHETLNRAQ